MEFTHGNAEKLKFCFLKIGKSNYERLDLLTIVTKTTGADMPAVKSGEKENAPNQIGNVLEESRQGAVGQDQELTFVGNASATPKSKLLRFGVAR